MSLAEREDRTPGLAVQKGGIETARLPNFSNRDYRQRERERVCSLTDSPGAVEALHRRRGVGLVRGMGDLQPPPRVLPRFVCSWRKPRRPQRRLVRSGVEPRLDGRLGSSRAGLPHPCGPPSPTPTPTPAPTPASPRHGGSRAPRSRSMASRTK